MVESWLRGTHYHQTWKYKKHDEAYTSLAFIRGFTLATCEGPKVFSLTIDLESSQSSLG